MPWTEGEALTPTNLNAVGTGMALFSVKDPTYGAKGDGVTDDTAAFISALSSARSLGVVFVPSGTYIVSIITLTTSGSELMGQGRTTILRMKNGANTSLVQNTPSISSIAIRHLTIDGNFSGNTVAPSDGMNGININNATNVTIDDVSVFNTYTSGIQFRNVTNGTIRNSIFWSNGTTNVNANGIAVIGFSGDTGSANIQIIGNTIYPNIGTGNGIFVSSAPNTSNHSHIDVIGNFISDVSDEAIEIKGCTYASVVGNVVRGSTTAGRNTDGVLIRGTSHVAVVGNVIEFGKNGITVWTGDSDFTSVANVSIVGNHVSQCSKDVTNGGGIRVLGNSASTSTVERVTITGNTVYACARDGIRLDVLTPATLRDIAISDNVVSGCSFTGIGIDTSSDVVVANNISNDNQGAGDGGTSAGIRVFNSANNVVITGNRCRGNDFGIRTENSADTIVITGNVLTGNTAPLSSTGTLIDFSHNVGY